MKGCRALTPTEEALVQKSFWGRFALRDRALFVLGVKTGLRISELLSLRVGDVWQHGRVVDAVSVRRRHMKRKSEGRTIPLHADAQAALLAWLNARGDLTPERCLFASREGGNRPIDRAQAYRILTEAYRANELTGKLGTHAMRKTFASHLYDRLGHDLVKVQQALGHQDITSTAAYLSFRQDEITAAILAG